MNSIKYTYLSNAMNLTYPTCSHVTSNFELDYHTIHLCEYYDEL